MICLTAEKKETYRASGASQKSMCLLKGSWIREGDIALTSGNKPQRSGTPEKTGKGHCFSWHDSRPHKNARLGSERVLARRSQGKEGRSASRWSLVGVMTEGSEER